ncbi:MAG: hypothetical protein Kow0068_21010 [Marinilabiliales bacterium]
MAYAIHGNPSPCEGPDLSDEGVHLQYSFDAVSWYDINYWDPNGGYDPQMTTWHNYNETIPISCIGNDVYFRWHQNTTSGNAYDNWGLDNVLIGNPTCNANWYKDGVPFASGLVLPPMHFDSSTTITVEYFCGTIINYDTLTVIIDTSCSNMSGFVYVDDNMNCQLDSGEQTISNIPIHIYNAAMPIETHYTDANGYYEFNYLSGGNYIVSLGNISVPCFDLFCPASGMYYTDSISGYMNFALNKINGFDLGVIGLSNGFIPGNTGHLIPYLSSLCNPQPGQLIIHLNDTLLHYQYSTPVAPTQIIGDSLIWDFNNIWDIYNLSVYYITDTAAVIGDIICVDFYINPTSGDLDTLNNHYTMCDFVSSSYDPNNKTVSPHGSGLQGYISNNTPLTYTINFMNTGTAPAQNIVIIDTLDPGLDEQSLNIVDYSHYVQTSIYGNILEFVFPNIMLPDSGTDYYGSMGHVTYRINQMPGLVPLTVINNTGNIFFDYNPPIITNETINTIEDLSFSQLYTNENNTIKLYPNPAGNRLYIDSFDKSNITILDINGKVIIHKKNCLKQSNFDISKFPAGVYFVKVQSVDRVETARFIKL